MTQEITINRTGRAIGDIEHALLNGLADTHSCSRNGTVQKRILEISRIQSTINMILVERLFFDFTKPPPKQLSEPVSVQNPLVSEQIRDPSFQILLRKRTGRIAKPAFWYALSSKCFGLL